MLKIDEYLPRLCWEIKQKHIFNISTTQSRWQLQVLVRRFLTRQVCLRDVHGKSIAPCGKTIFFKSMQRSDYDELFYNVVNAYGDESSTIDVSPDNVYYIRKGISSLLSKGVIVLRLFKLFLFFGLNVRLFLQSTFEYGFYKGGWLFFQLLNIKTIMQEMLAEGPARVVVFAEMQCLDRVLSMVCKGAGIPCATMQHGVYAEYLTTATVNTYNYNPPFVSHFLAWGLHTAELIKRYRPNVCVDVCGKPTLQSMAVEKKQPMYDCVVILDQNAFSEQNQRMLHIVKDAFEGQSAKLGLRFHPQNEPADYDCDGFLITTDEDWLLTDIIVAHTTSLMLDLLRAGARLYRFASNVETAFSDSNIEFENVEQLRDLIHENRRLKSETLDHYIACTGTAAIRNHGNRIKCMDGVF